MLQKIYKLIFNFWKFYSHYLISKNLLNFQLNYIYLSIIHHFLCINFQPYYHYQLIFWFVFLTADLLTWLYLLVQDKAFQLLTVYYSWMEYPNLDYVLSNVFFLRGFPPLSPDRQLEWHFVLCHVPYRLVLLIFFFLIFFFFFW